MAKLPVEKMRELERRFGEIEARMSAGPAADVYVKLASEYSELEPVVKKIREYEKAISEAADLVALLADKTTDKDMRELAEMELPEIESRIEELEKDMQVLRSRLYDIERQKVDSERSADRKSQVGSGDRSERIRTYNFPQGRVTDHRINLTLYKLDRMIEGEIDELVDALIADYQAGQLAQLGEQH